jgi:hypothetical protein
VPSALKPSVVAPRTILTALGAAGPLACLIGAGLPYRRSVAKKRAAQLPQIGEVALTDAANA